MIYWELATVFIVFLGMVPLLLWVAIYIMKLQDNKKGNKTPKTNLVEEIIKVLSKDLNK
jgi:hypothetical protein